MELIQSTPEQKICFTEEVISYLSGYLGVGGKCLSMNQFIKHKMKMTKFVCCSECEHNNAIRTGSDIESQSSRKDIAYDHTFMSTNLV